MAILGEFGQHRWRLRKRGRGFAAIFEATRRGPDVDPNSRRRRGGRREMESWNAGRIEVDAVRILGLKRERKNRGRLKRSRRSQQRLVAPSELFKRNNYFSKLFCQLKNN